MRWLLTATGIWMYFPFLMMMIMELMQARHMFKRDDQNNIYVLPQKYVKSICRNHFNSNERACSKGVLRGSSFGTFGGFEIRRIQNEK